MLPSRSGRCLRAGAFGAVGLLIFVLCTGLGAVSHAQSPAPGGKGKGGKEKAAPTPKAPGLPGGVPLPIGQEAKGLVLPDYDTEGRLRARFEAGTAKRVDASRIQFTGLKMTTFAPDSTIDLQIEMPKSMLDLNTRVISSSERTTVQRRDFNIAGDTMEFDTNARKGKLVGNVKMVISDSSNLTGKDGE